MLGIISKRYSNALFQIAKNDNKTDDFLKEITYIKELVEKNPELLSVLEHPKVTKEEKFQLVDSLFSDGFDKHMCDFMKLLILKDRINYFNKIVSDFTQLYYDYKNIVKADVTSAFELSEDEKSALILKLQGLYNKTVILDIKIDPKIIGGMYIKAQDKVIDATIKGRLEKLKYNLLYDLK